MLLRPSCPSCGRSGFVVCPRCAAELAPAPNLPAPFGIERVDAVHDYRRARALVTALKNGGRRDLVPWLASAMAAVRTPAPGTVVTWAPTGRTRQRQRGFDQAELLARAVARRWGVPARGLLRRLPGPAQSGRSAAERRAGPAFTAVGSVPATVLVIDDVATTGATLQAAAQALRAAGAARVEALVAARAAAGRAA